VRRSFFSAILFTSAIITYRKQELWEDWTRKFGVPAYQAMCSAVKIVTPSIAMSNMVRKSYPALAAEKFVVIRHGFDAASFTA